MPAAFARPAGRRGRCLLLAVAAGGATALLAAPALAAPTLGITMTHANAFGLEVASCPLGKESLDPDCGVDPFSGSGLSFARESGFDAYTITVKNTSATETAPSNEVGSTLTCVGGATGGASLAYKWLQNGEVIPGATGEKYELKADEGMVIQCEVTASDANGATAALSEGALVGPSGGEDVTVPPGGPVKIKSPAGKWLVGETVKCEPEDPAEVTVTGYQWLHNAEAIPGATAETYKLAPADKGEALQCQETETAANGSPIVAMSSSSDVVVTGVVPGGGEKPGEGENAPELPAAEALLPVATVEDQLPAGIVLAGEPHQLLPAPGSASVWACKILHGRFAGKEFEGPSAFRCSTSQTLEPGHAYEKLVASVNVTPRAANPSVNMANVSGGGMASASTTDETEITPAVPFGIHCFAVPILDEEQGLVKSQQEKEEVASTKNEKNCEEAKPPEPPIAAGGHPFSEGTEFVLNYTPSAGETALEPTIIPRLVSAAGGPKEVEAELPPGVLGNPQNIPECPFALLQVNSCPADAAVGYTQTTYANATIEDGKAHPFATPPPLVPGEPSTFHALVFNLVPTTGHPAEFGFVVIRRVPFVLDAKLRSDGDYGVSVGDNAIAEKVLGVRATFCEYGAHGSGSEFSCDTKAEAPLGAKPFLTNPTECSAVAPTWNLRTNPWDEPKDTESQAVAMNQLEGCDLLQFHPEIEFKPSPPDEGGTTEADEPTGVTLNLKVPQTNEASTRATPALKNIKMTLPEGMTASPSAADGLEACSNAQFGLGTEFGPGAPKVVPEPAAKPASCPSASQIGTVEVFTPLLSGAPVVEGAPPRKEEEYERLTCSQGMWSGGPWSRSSLQLEGGVEELENGNHERLKLSYQWLLNGSAIAGATEKIYAFTPALFALEKGKPLQCQITATNAGGSSVAVSRDTVVTPEPSPVPPFPPASVAAPSGTPSAGNTLTCAPGTWTSSAALAPFAYQWLRDGAPITGASSETYKLASEDEGKVIQCQVTASNETGPQKGGVTIADSAAVVVSPEPSSAPPLPGAALQGQLFVGEPECSPCTEANHDALDGRIFRLFLQIADPSAGVIVKVHGTTSVNEKTGQLTTEFLEQPQQPFELLQLKLKGGPRATLANPQTCGSATTTTELTPWSAGLGGPSGTEPGSSEEGDFPHAEFKVDGCPATMPFAPSFNAGTTGPDATAAGASPTFSLTFSREDREQDLSGLQVRMPLGLVGKIAGIPRCGEAEVHAAEANTGECPAASKIGTADAGAGPGPHPFFTEGNVYLTNAYKGAPFGLAVVTHAIAGPFNLGNVVVLSKIEIDPHTAAVTVTSNPLPQIIDGVPLRLRKVNVSVNRPDFMVNPTNCSAQQVAATITAAQGASAQVSSPFGLGGCTGLPFKPTFTATTNGQTSKTAGANLDVKITYPPGAYANIAKSVTELPIALPSRLTTIQKACPDTVFEANPAACDEGSVIGHAIAYTPLLANPLAGPAYLVSHGNRAFPDIEIVLQGEGITVDLDGLTDIKKGITKTTFESLPDSPISTFELILPQGPHSALAPNVEFPLCEQPSVNLPTVLTGQNGAVLKQNTKVAVTGCSPSVRITQAKLSGTDLAVTVTTADTGNLRASGGGLKTIKKRDLAPGPHQILLAFTREGMSKLGHHEKTSVRVSLSVGKKSVVKTAKVKL